MDVQSGESEEEEVMGKGLDLRNNVSRCVLHRNLFILGSKRHESHQKDGLRTLVSAGFFY